MKKLKKILAMALAMAMVLGMSVTTFAATPHEGDTTTVKITGLDSGATVNLYRIAEGVYGTDGSSGAVGFINYEWLTLNGTKLIANVNSPTAAEINQIAQVIKGTAGENVFFTDKDGDKVTLSPVNTQENLSGTEYSYTSATAGAYVAIITGGPNDKSIYNPVYLTASYGNSGDKAGSLIGGTISANSTYIGTNAVAKKSNPTIDKSVTGATEDTADESKKIATASVGKVLTFTLDKIQVPSYTANATNKTFFISDTMVTGLTFDYSSLNVSLGEKNPVVTKADSSDPSDTEGTVVFMADNKVIAKAVATKTGDVVTGFNINFNYDNLISNADTGAIYAPIVTYNAVINSTAVVAGEGNVNTATLYYAKQPNKGSTHDTLTTPRPDEANGLESIEDKETIYTYQLAFKKTGEGTDSDKLAGAIFGIYADAACKESSLIDTVTTDANGFAVSTRVGKGTYFIKELWAPAGYSLNDNIYKMEASWATATTTVTGSVTNRQYTTDKKEAARLTDTDDPKQVGWIKGGIFYEMAQYADAEAATVAGAQAAYIKSTSTSNTTSVTTIEATGNGTVTALTDANGKDVSAITNTKLTSLPSTGGIGTTIFTIGGCAIMIIAAGLYFASRRKKEV